MSRQPEPTVVYVVQAHSVIDEDFDVIGVYSTQELAEQAREAEMARRGRKCLVFPVEVDALPEAA